MQLACCKLIKYLKIILLIRTAVALGSTLFFFYNRVYASSFNFTFNSWKKAHFWLLTIIAGYVLRRLPDRYAFSFLLFQLFDIYMVYVCFHTYYHELFAWFLHFLSIFVLHLYTYVLSKCYFKEYITVLPFLKFNILLYFYFYSLE